MPTEKVLQAAKALFGAGSADANMPSTEIDDSDFTDGAIGILDVMVKAKLAPSKGEARRLVQQGGVSVNDEKVTDIAFALTKDSFADGFVVIKKGKKVFHKIILK